MEPRAGLDVLEKEKNFTLRREIIVENADLRTDSQFVNHRVCVEGKE